MNLIPRFRTYLDFIKVSHTLFSLPLLFAGALLAERGALTVRLIALILTAGVGARITAMALNRLIDRRIDALNPRTADRALPTGRLRPAEAWGVAAAGGAAYVISAAMISPLCLALSPIPLILFTIYPFLKRITAWCHLGLGIVWATAPLGAWVAVTQSAHPSAAILWLAVFSVLWVTGFDIIYATADEIFDKAHHIHSLPALLGKPRALQIAAWCHLFAFGCLVMLWHGSLQHRIGILSLACTGFLLIIEHRFQNKELAFLPLNIIVGCFVLLLVVTYRMTVPA